VEITGKQEKIDGLDATLRPFGIVEMVQTGTVAMTRGGQGAAAQVAHSDSASGFRAA
jgi:acetolactate synthase-1/3 small subunit